MLPKPRELFPAKRPNKGSADYLDQVAAEPLRSKTSTPEQQYKSQMAEARRKQIRIGLTSLRTRKEKELEKIAKTSMHRQLQRTELLKQAEREDARLTNSSIVAQMKPDAQSSIEALEAEVATARAIHERKVANIARVTAEKHVDKMDALHTLYMNARHFVTTEDQLKDLIDQQFDTSPPATSDYRRAPAQHADFRGEVSTGTSMWNFGPPAGVKTMINAEYNVRSTEGMSGVLSRVLEGETSKERAAVNREQERFKKIAEKLSGGKI